MACVPSLMSPPCRLRADIMRDRCAGVKDERLVARATDRGPDHLARDDELDAAVLLTAFSRVVGRYRKAWTVSLRRYAVLGHALGDEKVADRRGALLRQPLVDVVGASRIGEAFGLDVEPRMGEHDAGKTRQLFARRRAQLVSSGLEQHV